MRHGHTLCVVLGPASRVNLNQEFRSRHCHDESDLSLTLRHATNNSMVYTYFQERSEVNIA